MALYSSIASVAPPKRKVVTKQTIDQKNMAKDTAKIGATSLSSVAPTKTVKRSQAQPITFNQPVKQNVEKLRSVSSTAPLPIPSAEQVAEDFRPPAPTAPAPVELPSAPDLRSGLDARQMAADQAMAEIGGSPLQDQIPTRDAGPAMDQPLRENMLDEPLASPPLKQAIEDPLTAGYGAQFNEPMIEGPFAGGNEAFGGNGVLDKGPTLDAVGGPKIPIDQSPLGTDIAEPELELPPEVVEKEVEAKEDALVAQEEPLTDEERRQKAIEDAKKKSTEKAAADLAAGGDGRGGEFSTSELIDKAIRDIIKEGKRDPAEAQRIIDEKINRKMKADLVGQRARMGRAGHGSSGAMAAIEGDVMTQARQAAAEQYFAEQSRAEDDWLKSLQTGAGLETARSDQEFKNFVRQQALDMLKGEEAELDADGDGVDDVLKDQIDTAAEGSTTQADTGLGATASSIGRLAAAFLTGGLLPAGEIAYKHFVEGKTAEQIADEMGGADIRVIGDAIAGRKPWF